MKVNPEAGADRPSAGIKTERLELEVFAMKLAGMVRAECANFTRGGGCIFTGGPCPILDSKACDLSLAVSSGRKPDPQGPSYFEGAVLPLAQTLPEYANVPLEYSQITGRRVTIRVRNCECGKPRPVGKKFCEPCRRSRRRETKRISKFARRKAS